MSEAEHTTIFDSLGAYALGALPEGEHAAVAAHLEHCPVCAEDARSLERAAVSLIEVVPMVEPPRELRDRIMAVVEPEAALLRATSRPPAEARAPARTRRSWADALSLRWAATAAAMLVLGGFVGATALDADPAPSDPTRTLASQTGRGHPWVEMYGEQAHLVVDGLPAPARDKVYELWIQSGDQAPRPASADLDQATFRVETGRVEIPARLNPGDRVMVTAEPAGGSKIPTTTPVVITARV